MDEGLMDETMVLLLQRADPDGDPMDAAAVIVIGNMPAVRSQPGWHIAQAQELCQFAMKYLPEELVVEFYHRLGAALEAVGVELEPAD